MRVILARAADGMIAAMVGERTVDGFSALTLSSSAAGGIEATFVPGCRDGRVLAASPRRGAAGTAAAGCGPYVAERATMGIPMLYPWANRLGASGSRWPAARSTIDPRSTPVRVDADGLPMHGLLAGTTGWRVERHEDTGDGAVLAARLRFAAQEALAAAFPFAHELRARGRAERGRGWTITTTVQASEDAPVPIAFGYHPYLRLPGVSREWRVEVPVRERLRLDAHMLPTGERVGAEVFAGRLGARTFDDAFVAPAGGGALRPRRERPADRAGVPGRQASATRRSSLPPRTTWSPTSR